MKDLKKVYEEYALLENVIGHFDSTLNTSVRKREKQFDLCYGKFRKYYYTPNHIVTISGPYLLVSREKEIVSCRGNEIT
jgi:hypothetical protein